MTEIEIKKIFEWLNNHFNKDNIFTFELTSIKNIKMYTSYRDEIATFSIENLKEFIIDE